MRERETLGITTRSYYGRHCKVTYVHPLHQDAFILLKPSKIAPLTLPKITHCGNLNTVAKDSGKQIDRQTV